jgi:hypothetical protein
MELPTFGKLIEHQKNFANFPMQKVYSPFFTLGIAILAAFVSSDRCIAERPPTEGSIAFEDEPTKRTPYEAGQTEAIQLFQTVLTELQSGTITKHTASLPVIRHLAGTYLYCTSKRGSCPAILDAILAVDIANASISGAASCPILEEFWSSYKKWEFDKREGYLRGITASGTAESFAREELFRYQRCQPTVYRALREEKTARKIAATKALANGEFLLKQFKLKVPNVFAALGIDEGKGTKKPQSKNLQQNK